MNYIYKLSHHEPFSSEENNCLTFKLVLLALTLMKRAFNIITDLKKKKV